MSTLIRIIRVLWRSWFYVIAGSIIIILFPALIVLTSHEKLYPAFYKVARFWAKAVLFSMGFKLKIIRNKEIDFSKSHMFAANHTSMIDIMVMLAVVKSPIVFVGKRELINLPFFGYLFKRTSILVDRSNATSRKEVYQSAQRKLKRGFGVCIFPEGGVPKDENTILDEFKNGIFSLAIEHKIPIVPMVFFDCKKRYSYTINSGSPGLLRVKILDIIDTQNLVMKDKNKIRKQAFNTMYQELASDLEVQENKL